MRHRIVLPVAAMLSLGIAAAAAQQAAPEQRKGFAMSDQDAPARRGKEPPPSPATRAYMDAAIRMHSDMAVAYSNDADRDFAATLAAHHQGAVEIAAVELQYGTDPEMRRLAEAVLEARRREIALLDGWRAKHRQ